MPPDFLLMKFSWQKEGVERVGNHFNQREEYMHIKQKCEKISHFHTIVRSLELIKKNIPVVLDDVIKVSVSHVITGLGG